MGIQVLVSTVNEKAAHIEALTRVSPRNLDDQKNRVAIWGNFYSVLWQMVENSRHVIPNEDLITRMDRWLSSYQYIGEQRTVSIKNGILLSREWQKELKDLGIIDLNISGEFATFPFKYYLNMMALSRLQTRKRALQFAPDKDDVHPDETDAENLGRPSPLNNILGFSGNGAFGSMYFMVYSTLNRLLSAGQQEEAITYFYSNIGNFASVFDLIFLTNCIKIESNILGTEDSTSPLAPPIPEGNETTKELEEAVNASMSSDIKRMSSMPPILKKNAVFQLQLAEFAWLMKRANITPNPDVMQIGVTDLNTPHHPSEVTRITGRE